MRAGVTTEAEGRSLAWARWFLSHAVPLFVLAYVTGFVIFPPAVIQVSDEGSYVAQAVAWSRGLPTLPVADAVSNQITGAPVSRYAPGTSLLMVLPVWLGGWRAAFTVPLVSVVVYAFVTRLLIVRSGCDSWWAALFLCANVPLLCLGRLAMSDVVSASLSSLFLLAVWDFPKASLHRVVWAGLVAGTAVGVRETSAVLLLPIAFGAFVRLPLTHKAVFVLCGALPLISGALVNWLTHGELWLRGGGIRTLRAQPCGSAPTAVPDRAQPLCSWGYGCGFLVQWPVEVGTPK